VTGTEADWLLPELLALAVPLEIERMRGVEPQVRIDYAQSRWEVFQPNGGKSEMTAARLTGGAVLMMGGKGAGEEFAIVAQVLGALAHQPGGVTAFGQHWCADHAQCEAAAAEAKDRLGEAGSEATPNDLSGGAS
jgi:hypothetical protein